MQWTKEHLWFLNGRSFNRHNAWRCLKRLRHERSHWRARKFKFTLSLQAFGIAVAQSFYVKEKCCIYLHGADIIVRSDRPRRLKQNLENEEDCCTHARKHCSALMRIQWKPNLNKKSANGESHHTMHAKHHKCYQWWQQWWYSVCRSALCKSHVRTEKHLCPQIKEHKKIKHERIITFRQWQQRHYHSQ